MSETKKDKLAADDINLVDDERVSVEWYLYSQPVEFGLIFRHRAPHFPTPGPGATKLGTT